MIGTSRDLAFRAYKSVVDEIAEKQQRIVLRKLLKQEFGKEALDPWGAVRHFGREGTVLSLAERNIEEYDLKDRRRLADLVKIARLMEETFSRIHESDDQAFSAAMSDLWKRNGKL